MNIEKKLAELNGVIDSLYAEKVNALIRKKYSIGAELSIQRQRDEKPDEFAEYYAYCEECKRLARIEVYGEEARS
jgi:hypothetical protein